MARPIKLTQQMSEELQAEFFRSISFRKMFDGTVSFSKTFRYTGDGGRAYVTFTTEAFAKMQMLIQAFNSEVAWHGVAHREEGKPASFIVSDILVYPQLITGATVNTDQAEYTAWLYSLDDDVFSNVRMQGHSHNDFGTTPSAVDLEHQGKIMEQLEEDMFYIFMIWNKKLERTIKIYDLQNNVLYENSDISVRIGSNGVDLVEFLDNAKKICRPKYATGSGYQSNHPVSPGGTGKSAETAGAEAGKSTGVAGYVDGIKSKPKTTGTNSKPMIGCGWSGRQSSYDHEDYDDYNDPAYPYGGMNT